MKIKGIIYSVSNTAICFYLASLLYLLELGLLPLEQQIVFLKLKKKKTSAQSWGRGLIK